MEDFEELNTYCGKQGVKFMSTPFDLGSVDFLAGLNMDYMKIPSGEITNYPYLKKIAGYGEKTILSTGMSTLDEVKAAIKVLCENGLSLPQITILHCNTEYPTPYEDVNLLAMAKMGNEIGTTYGYSDHTKGIVVPIAAVSLGASVIEKHFTLDRNLPGPDHKASLEPDELKEMVDAIRIVEQSLGSSNKQPSLSEQKNISIVRKSIVAACPIKKREVLTENNLTVKRPANGISPMRWEEVIGTKAVKDFEEEELIVL